MTNHGCDDSEKHRRDTREYVLDMLAQLAVMARECGDGWIAESVERVVAEALSARQPSL